MAKGKLPEELNKKFEFNKQRERAQGTFTSTFTGFPIAQWRDWETSCKEQYGDCRWLKMWDDHRKARELEMLDTLVKLVNSLKERIDVLDKKELEQDVKAFNNKN